MSTARGSDSGGPRRIGKYEIREPLGRGGMGEVWKAWDGQLERYVAIKVLHGNLQHDPDFLKRFIREARAVASLHHPNIVQVYDFQILTENSSPPGDGGAIDAQTAAYMVMDYVEGPTLDDYIRSTSRRGKFPAAHEITYLFTAISRAIDYAHQRGMIHRDIKPANILLDQRPTTNSPLGEPILTDFGIVKVLGASTSTLSGAWLGTPSYISPEQANGHSGNERSDIYSLGVILYEVCTGVRPFIGATPYSIIMQHIQVTPTSPSLINPYIPPALSEVILHSLQKDPLARFSSASEMAAALVQALAPASNEGMAHKDKPQPLQPGSLSPALQPPASGGPVLTSPPSVSSTPQFQTPTGVNPPLRVTPASPADASPLPLTGGAAPAFSPLPLGSPSSLAAPNTIVPDRPAIQSSPSALPPPRRVPPLLRRRGLFVGLLLLLIILLAASGLSVFYLLPQTHQGVQPVSSQVVGHAYFGSSGQLNEHTAQGLDDMLRLNLSNISPPAANKAYYLWALSDVNQNPPTSLLLGKLMVTSGKVDFFYAGDSQLSNLFGTYSRLLITEESAITPPLHPSSDRSTWRYHAELPQTPRVTDNRTALGDLRALLYKPEETDVLPDEAYGGFFTPFLRNTRTITQLADSTRGSWSKKDIAALRNQIIQILDYLDGTVAVQTDVPPDTPLLVKTRIPLITQNSAQQPRSYLDHITNELSDLTNTPGLSSEMIQLATQAFRSLMNNVQAWLDQARVDASGLATINDAQLLEPSTGGILSDLQTQIHNAYNGLRNPASGKVQQEGALQIFNDVQSLIIFDLKPYAAT